MPPRPRTRESQRRSALRREIRLIGQGGDTPSAKFLAFQDRWQRALDNGLRAAAQVYHKAITAKLARGYTSGQYVTGKNLGKVRIGRVFTDRQTGARVIRVYSTHFVHRFYEFGAFINGKYTRVEHWRLASEESGADMAAAFHNAFRDVLAA